MSVTRQRTISRRGIMRRAAAAAMLGPLFKATQGSVSAQSQVNRNSAPSDLKITDMRACRIAANYDYPIIKIYTNQDVYGLGEVRDAGVEGIALILKPYLVGKNPLNIEGNLRALRQFAGPGRMGGGYSAVDMALHDITGKVYGVPAYRLVGEKVRDRIRIYADTTDHKDPKIYAERMRKRKEMGLTFFKMDLHTELVADRPGAVNERGVATEKGLGYLCEYIEAIRDVIGWGVPLAADHFGPLNVKDAIRYARAFEKYQLSWAEDLVPWPNWQGLKEIRNNTTTPVLTGEDVFGLRNGFDVLHRQSRGGRDSSGYRNLGRLARDQADRRLRRAGRCSGGDAPRRIAGGRLRGVSLRRHFLRTSWQWRTTRSTCPGGRTW